jgi:hypothetical protein
MFSHLYPIFFFLLTCASLSQKGHKGSRIWRNVLCNTDGQVRTGLLYLRFNLCAISLYDMVTVVYQHCSSSVVSAGILRVFGREVAELPLVATSNGNHGKVRS